MSGDAEMSRRGSWWWLRAGLILVVVAWLAIDAVVHLHLTSSYDGVKSSVLTQGDLFRVEAALAIIAALALEVRPRRWTALIAFLVRAGGFAAVLVYQYVNVGATGPLPNMYDPLRYGEKTLSVGRRDRRARSAVLLVLMYRRIPATGQTVGVTEDDVTAPRPPSLGLVTVPMPHDLSWPGWSPMWWVPVHQDGQVARRSQAERQHRA